MNLIFNPKTIKAVVGLGNPGDEYARTYHNIGQQFLTHFQNTLLAKDFSIYKKFSHTKKGRIILAKPETFMNDSGIGLKEVLAYFKLKPEEVLVVHDDADLPLGSYKLSFGRGSAGHKGVESVIKHFKTKNFWRARVGIRPDDDKKKKAMDFVLATIGKKEMKILKKVFSEVENLVTG